MHPKLSVSATLSLSLLLLISRNSGQQKGKMNRYCFNEEIFKLAKIPGYCVNQWKYNIKVIKLEQ